MFVFLIPIKILYKLIYLRRRRLWKQLCFLIEWTVEQLCDPIWLHKFCEEAWLSTYATKSTRQPGRVGLWNEQLILLGDWSYDFMSIWYWAMTTSGRCAPPESSNHLQIPALTSELPHIWAYYSLGKEYYIPRAGREPKKSVVLC